MPEKKSELTVAEQISVLSSSLVQDDKGSWIAPEVEGQEPPDDVLLEAARTDKRFKETQGAFTKSQQSLKASETTNEQLAKHLLDNTTMHITDEQREVLDDLKISDPETWRTKINEYEQETRKLMTDKVAEFRAKGDKSSELVAREAAFKQFSEITGIKLTDNIVENSLPASYSKDLEAGKITFEKFLEKAQTFLSSDKVIKDADKDPKDGLNLDDLPGGSKPSDSAQDQDSEATYKTEMY